jgi:Aldo/keto reductase family
MRARQHGEGGRSIVEGERGRHRDDEVAVRRHRYDPRGSVCAERMRKGQQTDLRRAAILGAFSDERWLDAVEQLIPLAGEAGLPMTHLAMAFAIAHPGVTRAIIWPHTMEQLDDLLAEADVTRTDEILDRIDEIVPPGSDVGTLDQAYVPPPLLNPSLRRRSGSQSQR